jgi:multiple sugar transport system substrate-binding protein
MKRSTRWMTLAVVFALVFSACGSKASPSPSVGAPASPSGEASPQPSPTPVPAPSFSGPAVTLKWFCCLGGGDDPSTEKVFRQVIKDFNASQTHITVVYDHVAYDGARDAFATRLGSPNPPDIVGPLGVGGASAFSGQWLDLTSYIKKFNVDMSDYDPAVINLHKSAVEGQVGIPFAVYPSFLFYQPDMFDEAGLDAPPAKYGDKYMLNGQPVEWNYDTARQVAMKLTVDNKGKDATESGFDPNHIVQFGFEPQRGDLRTMGAQFFGAGKLLSDDGKTAQIPDAWAAGWKLVYDGIWKDHFIESYAVNNLKAFNGGGDAFNAGKVGMEANFLWDVCCVQDAGGNWNIAALPSYNGKVTAPINADTFAITKNSAHPDEAFYALAYMTLGPERAKLLNAISGFPAKKADQASFFTQLEQQKNDKGKLIYPPGVNWQIATDAVQYADTDPNSEAPMPKYNKSLDVLTKYLTRWTSTPGLDMDAELAKLKAELQATWDKK